MINRFVEKLKGYAGLSAEEAKLLEDATRGGRRYPRGHDLIREGDKPSLVFVVLEGWACRYKILPAGTRQIISFLMPGDFCDMHVATLDAMDHGIATVTEATVATISQEVMTALTAASANLTKAFWWTQLVDEAVLRSMIVSMGRRTSIERVAHLLCELTIRMLSIGIASEDRYEFPFTQIVLADAVGLTPVHVNRVVNTLRRAGALEVGPSTMVVSDLDKLAKIAGFDDNYLHRGAGSINLNASANQRFEVERDRLAAVTSPSGDREISTEAKAGVKR